MEDERVLGTSRASRCGKVLFQRSICAVCLVFFVNRADRFQYSIVDPCA